MRRSPQGSLFRGSGGGREGGAAGVHCISQHPGQVVSALEYECVYTCVCKCVCVHCISQHSGQVVSSLEYECVCVSV